MRMVTGTPAVESEPTALKVGRSSKPREEGEEEGVVLERSAQHTAHSTQHTAHGAQGRLSPSSPRGPRGSRRTTVGDKADTRTDPTVMLPAMAAVAADADSKSRSIEI